jgi:AAA domain-containing protein
MAARTSAESLAAFKLYTMSHPKLKAMHEQVWRAIREPGGASLFFILGPTGVGKTTLVSRLMQQLTRDLQPQLEQDHERMAVAGIEAEAPTHGNYDFKQHFKRSLKALNEILIEYKLDLSWQSLETRKQGSIIINAKTNAGALRGSLEDSLKRRRPTAFFIDEAHHLGKVSGGRKFQDHLDVIKSLADTTETLHVLVGTYELQSLLNLSDQLSRRSLTFHFERYRPSRPADIKVFQNIIWNFQQRLPFPDQQDLREQSEYLMERSLGCVGILKGWIVRAADAALDGRVKTLTIDLLKRHEPTNAEWKSIATTLLEGEEAMRESEAEIESLRLRLRQESSSAKARKSKRVMLAAEQRAQSQARPSRHPGERLPRRDSVGRK